MKTKLCAGHGKRLESKSEKFLRIRSEPSLKSYALDDTHVRVNKPTKPNRTSARDAQNKTTCHFTRFIEIPEMPFCKCL